MNKTCLEGINGSLEINDKYVYVILKGEYQQTEEHIIWYEEIEDILYKKPTRDKHGFITLYLSTKSFVTKKKKSYKIILDRIDEKSIEIDNYVYKFIKGIIDNKEVEVLEAVEKEEKVEEKIEEPIKEEQRDDIKEIREIIREYNELINEMRGNSKETLSTDSVDKTIEKPIEKEEAVISFKEEEYETKEDSNYSYIPIEKEIIEKVDDSYEDELEEQEEINDVETKKSIKDLESKIHEIEKELKTISFKEIIISDYIDETVDRKKIEKLIIELKKLIEKLEKIKKEIIKHEKILNGEDFIKLDNGNVTVLSISKSLYDETEINKYIDAYKGITTSLERIQNDTNELSNSAEEKKTNVGLSDEEYDRRINQFRGVKSNKEFIKKLIDDVKKDFSNIKWRIETTIEKKEKFKFVRKEISQRTKDLLALTALNGMRPRRSRLSMVASTLFTGTSAVYDFFGFDIKKIEYEELVKTEILEGLENVDTHKARLMLETSKEQIESILAECEKRYGEYPKFASLKKDLVSLKKDIEKQDKELTQIEDKLTEYRLGPKVKVLRQSMEQRGTTNEKKKAA